MAPLSWGCEDLPPMVVCCAPLQGSYEADTGLAAADLVDETYCTEQGAKLDLRALPAIMEEPRLLMRKLILRERRRGRAAQNIDIAAHMRRSG